MGYELSQTYSMDQHPFHRISSDTGRLPYGSTSTAKVVYTRIGFLVIVNFWGDCNSHKWVNTYSNTKEPIPFGYRPSDENIGAVVTGTQSGHNAMLIFKSIGTVELIGMCAGYIHGTFAYHTDDPLII